MTRQEVNRMVATNWFFSGGYEGMNKLEQVEYLVDECGYTEEGAWDLVYGCTEGDVPDFVDYTPDDYYGN